MEIENFEHLSITVRHPKDWKESDTKLNSQLLARFNKDDRLIKHASSEGWEIKATTLIETENNFLEIIHLQRSSFHPHFHKETFSVDYWETDSQIKKAEMSSFLNLD